MKNLKKISMLLLVAVTLFMTSCKKDPVKTPPTKNYSTEAKLDLGSKVNAKFFGRIVDEQGNALSGVAIKAGNKTATTDAKGVFMIQDASVFEKMAFVTAEKSGYFFGSRSIIPSTTAVNNIRITMLAMDIVGSVNAGEEKTISLASGAKIDFKGKYIDASGNAYTGVVNVSFKHLPALADATAEQMPGMLYAQDQNENAGVLETYGMMAVELTSSSGSELQIDPNSNATIHMPVDASQLANAPATIPLWHFDEVAGYWIEEGEATLVNGEYIGNVTHFSFWNCDRFGDDAKLYGTVTDQNGNPLSDVTVAIITPNASTAGQIANDGTFFTYVPANVAITLEVRDECGNIVASFNVGPYATNSTNTETLAVTLSSSNSVTGLFYDCSNNLITNGYVVLTAGANSYYQTVTNGTINIPILFCNIPTNLTVIAYDYDNIQETNIFTVPIVSPITNLGNLIACNAVNEYVTYSIDGGAPTTIFPPFSCNESSYLDSITNLPVTSLSCYASGGGLGLNCQGTSLGAYSWGYNPGQMSFYSNGVYIAQGQVVNITFQLISYGAVGSYLDITFSGTYVDYVSMATRTISGTIHVLRDS